MPADVVVVGGGVGGLAASIRLAASGHHVVLCERTPAVGGKLTRRQRDGWTIDVGPSLLTLPQVFEDLCRCAGTTLADHVELVALDPQCRYRFADGTWLDVHADPAATAAAVEAWSPGSGAQWRAAMDHAGSVWDVAERTFLAGSMTSARQLVGRLRSPRDLWAIDGARTLARSSRSAFTDPRLRTWLDRYATYSGSSAQAAPATLACIAAVEARHGCWYVRSKDPAQPGGLWLLVDLLHRLAVGLGVEVRTEAEVGVVEQRDGRVRGVRLADGQAIDAPVVVADVDARHLYADLVDAPRAARRARRAPRSSSGFAVVLGVEGTTPALAHHTVAFSADPEREQRQLFEDRVPVTDPTTYVCCAARSDPAVAPEGSEGWFVLVNAPSIGAAWDGAAPGYTDHVLDVLARRGLDLSGRLRFVEALTPADLEARHHAAGGAIYGSSSNGRRAAFARPANRGPIPGLYLVGGSTHPGGGLPLVALSAAFTTDLVGSDGYR